MPQPLIQIVASRDELVDGARVLPDESRRSLSCSDSLAAKRRANSAELAFSLLSARSAARERLGMIVLQLLELGLVPLQRLHAAASRVRCAISSASVRCSASARMLGRECFDARGMFIALDLQRFVALVQDRVRIVRPHDVRFEIGNALQDAIDVDRERFRRRPRRC